MKCSCGAITNCTCELPKLAAKTQEQDVVMKFLVGLDDSCSAIRSQFLLQSQFPLLAKVYSLLLQEQSQRSLNLPIQTDFVAMLAKNPNVKFYKDKKKHVKCSHCDAPGHTIHDKCFQLIGYPHGWKGPRGTRVNHDSKPSANALVKSPNKEETSDASNLLFN
ncbi:hypothetical protein ACS0TY_029179 [Phlomoides rotata]